MFKNDQDRGPLNHAQLDVVTVVRNIAAAKGDAQRWENEGGAAAHERVPQPRMPEMAYHRSPPDADCRPDGYVPALLAQLKLRQE